MISDEELRGVVERLPSVRFAMGYGSGVVQQQQQHQQATTAAHHHGRAVTAAGGEQPMRDLILAVDDPLAFHQHNICINKKHYSGVAYFGAELARDLQEWAAGIYFNPYVRINGQLVKYGVISHARLLSDLQNWDSLYVSGRMQKPYKDIIKDKAVDEACKANLQGALCASLLTLPEEFSEQQLWQTVTQLSYQGDFRMKFGENPHKIANIVTTENIQRFRHMYHTPLQHQLTVGTLREKQPGLFEQDYSPSARMTLFGGLPLTVQDRVDGASLASRPQALAAGVSSELQRIVKTSSRNQAIKGVLTAGLTKTVVYASAKLRKMYAAKR
eukprot:TRINITY_DN256_c2_g1_i1.p1 TRINITY_DN256_c2_g1~~TRINITY_DN256_c2_g1_i1.p1  ORF type:complete len:329 (-),score=56.72 TRINITY_DN256_c2_g1_i1:16-1002(-)